MRIVPLVSGLNKLKTMVGDSGNAYLEARPDTLHCCWTRTQTSGARFHDKPADTFRCFGFKPCFAGSDVLVIVCG
jgi:hypothetical protein